MSFKYNFDWLLGNIQLQFIMRLFAGRVVGGAVRNGLLQKIYPEKVWQIPLDDLDIATIYTPNQMIAIAELFKFTHIPTGIEHGTMTILGRELNEKYTSYIADLIKTDDFKVKVQEYKLHEKDLIEAVHFLCKQNLQQNTSVTQVYELTTLRIDLETDGRHAIVEFTQDWEKDASRRDFTINAMYVDYESNVYDYFNGLEDLQNMLVKFVGEAEKRIQEDYLRILRFFRFNAYYGKQPWSQDCVKACKENMEGLKPIAQERLWREWFKLMKAVNPWDIVDLMLECKFFQTLKWPIPNMELIKNNKLAYATNIGAMAIFTGDWSVCKTSNAELKYIKSLSSTKLLDATDWLQARYDNGEEWIVDKQFVDNFNAQEYLKEFKTDIILPVNGKDLAAENIKPGPEMGKILHFLKRKWFESKMTMDKESLMKFYQDSIKS